MPSGDAGGGGSVLSNVFIHIGFPKTATTTLQGALMRHGPCGYLGKGLRERGAPEGDRP